MMVVSRLADLGARLRGTVGLSADCHPPDRRRRDLDNIPKALQDAIVHAGVLDDDSQIRLLHLEMKEPQPPGGTVHVHLAPLPAGGG